MECKRCGAELQQGALICMECGTRQRDKASTVRCASCYGRVPLGLTVCPHCGRTVRAAGPRWAYWLAGAAAVLVVLLWMFDLLPVGRVQQQAARFGHFVASLVEVPDVATPALPQQEAIVPATASVPLVTQTQTISQSVTLPAPDVSASTTVTPTVASATGTDPEYTVGNGDTLATIGERTGLPVSLLAQINGIAEDAALQPGQKLRLPTPTPAAPPTVETAAPPPAAAEATPTPPAPTATPASGQVYNVRSGDSLAIIASRFGLTWEELAAANNLTSRSVLQIGQEIVIPPSQP